MVDFTDWIGRTNISEERADRWPLMGLFAALDRADAPEEGAPIPPLAHWLYFPPAVPQSRMGRDGHPERGDFLPPLRQTRRMWAASGISFGAPILVGERVKKTAKIADVAEKTGKSGTLIFVNVENTYEMKGERVLCETQTLVYRDDPKPNEAAPPPKPAPADPAWSMRIDPDPVLLFRYSAVTFNAHRIHYDEPYAKAEEGYPGIVVHGQLTATLMLQALLREHPEHWLGGFSFRAVKPLFSGSPFFVEGAPGPDGSFKLWARNSDGHLSMTADLTASERRP